MVIILGVISPAHQPTRRLTALQEGDAERPVGCGELGEPHHRAYKPAGEKKPPVTNTAAQKLKNGALMK
ncbi:MULTISPECIES: hypothetical protein [Pseudomonadaceae]|uniref:hypothetical protein n=1 Tax=Pseudomonadaceae TaxID=135621 RepID=UPI0011135CC9|nr:MULTISPECIES: hypothetical protein [Pseudomonas]MCO7554041.1 hypothetical protein [Pseudomonas otitidis]MCP1621044.1 hypothetical protein [Pseudomonas otitidis]